MGLWSIIKGKGTQFKGPPAVGQVSGFSVLSSRFLLALILFYFLHIGPFEESTCF